MIQSPINFGFKVTKQDIGIIQSVLESEGWKTIQKFIDTGTQLLERQCASSIRSEPWLERGIWRGWVLVAQTLQWIAEQDIDELGKDEITDLEQAIDARLEGESKGGYDFDYTH